MAHLTPSRRTGLLLSLALTLVLFAFGSVSARGYEVIVRANVAAGALQTNGGQRPAINSNGRYTAYWSDSPVIVPGDTNNTGDIFVFDRNANASKRVNIGPNGVQANGPTENIVDISDSGGIVVYASDANNLTAGDTNNQRDVFITDQFLNATVRIVPDAENGPQGNAASFNPVVSPDGRFVAFRSYATNFLDAGVDSNGKPDIILFDRMFNTFTQFDRINEGRVGGNVTQSNNEDPNSTFALSNNAEYAVFDSIGSNLVPSDSNARYDVFFRNRIANPRTTTRISVGPAGVQANGNSIRPAISANGRWVVFESDASNLIANDTNGKSDIFLWDSNNPSTLVRVSVDSAGIESNGHSRTPRINSTGRYITFWSDANNLVDLDTNNQPDIFVHDRVTGITTRVNIAGNEAQANRFTQNRPDISNNGAYVTFESEASNLVGGDTNNSADIFVALGGIISPNNLAATESDTTIALNWSDNTTNEQSFVVQRRPLDGNWTTLATLSANVTTYTDSALPLCITYRYRVLAVKDGIRSPSNSVNARLTNCPPSPFTQTTPATASTVINPAALLFTWQPSQGAQTYTLNVRTSADALVFNAALTTAACSLTQCQYTLTPSEAALLVNGDYKWSVIAQNTSPTAVTATNAPFTLTVNNLLAPREFVLRAPANLAYIRHVDALSIRWQNNPDAASYSLRVTQISNSTAPRDIGDSLLLNSLTPATDADGLTCTNVLCVYTLNETQKAELDNGYYSWTVFASSPGGTVTEASNGNFEFTLNQAEIALLNNGSFELDSNNDGIPNAWKVQNASNDNRRCDTAIPSTIAYDGQCAFRFIARSGEASVLFANGIAKRIGTLSNAETLKLSLQAKGTNLNAKPSVQIVITFTDNTSIQRTFRLDMGTYNYTLFSDSNIIVDKKIKSVRVNIRAVSTAGTLLVDDVKLLAVPRAPVTITNTSTSPSTDGLIPLPAPADNTSIITPSDGGLIPLPPPPEAGQ